MEPIELTDEENRQYLIFKLKQYEEEYDRHKTNEETLLSNDSDEFTGSFIQGERDAMSVLDELHSDLKIKLEEIN